MHVDGIQARMPVKKSVQEHRKYQEELDLRIIKDRDRLLEMAKGTSSIEEVRTLFESVVHDIIEKYRSVLEMLADQKKGMVRDIYEQRQEDVKEELETQVSALAVSVDYLLERRRDS